MSLDAENIVFTVTAVGVGMGTAIGTFLKLGKHKNGKAGGDPFSQGICDERHQNIAARLTEIREHQNGISAKLDRLTEHLLK